MSDLISRQAAIKAICEDGTWLESQGCLDLSGYSDRLWKAAYERGKEEAIQSTQKTGEWIKIDKYDKESNVQCSACLEEFDYIDGVCYLCHGYELPPFCPSCGVRMEGEK